MAQVLVIDDSDLARTAMERSLRDAGITVVSLESPIGATRKILQEQVQVVVIDVNMPSIRGDKLVTLFRQNPRFDKLKLILISGESGGLTEMAHSVGAHEVVEKTPDYAVRLVDTVQRLLRA